MTRRWVVVLLWLTRAAAADEETDEYNAWLAARPVFDKYCAPCHSQKAAHPDREALEHLDMTSYPLGGEHAKLAGSAVREVLGGTGEKPTMPKGSPGAVQGDDLKLVFAWADAFDKAYPPASMSGGHDHMDMDHDHMDMDHDHMEMGGMHHDMAGMSHMDHGGGYALPFAFPREGLIPGRPGMAGGIHLMVNGFAHLLNPGLGGYRIENPGAGGFDGGRTVPLLTDDWAMAYWRQSHGWVEALIMLNFEPLTIGEAGYPEVGQSGEGLWDAQHAHQLIHQAMVAVHPLSGLSGGAVRMGQEGDYDLSLFFGQGSATIGPPIFMHRASSPGPSVPRKHHKGENPHETFPVLGASFRWHGTWLEASAFSALELMPDDTRFRPHAAAPESFAARVRQDLGGWLELQLSGERLREQGHGEPDAYQASASAYGYGSRCGWRFDGLLDWALDRPDGGRNAQAAVAELAVRDPSYRDTLWMRSEFNQREEATGGVSSPWLFQTLGFEHAWARWQGLQLGLYGEATFGHIPASQAPRYGHDDFVTLDLGLHLSGMWMLDERFAPMRM
jgi:hypothetical protein